MTAAGLRLLVVGASFGRWYFSSLRAHPGIGSIALCDPDETMLASVGDSEHIPSESRHRTLDEALDRRAYDAAMILSPIPFHAEQTLTVLRAGLHCACTVPMASNLEDLARVAEARRASGKVYFMMETGCFSPEFLFIRDRVRSGAMGDLQFLRGVFFHHLDRHPAWWHGLPPMHYITHALGPLLMLAGRTVKTVACMGSGRLPAGFERNYGNPFPVETALFELGPDPIRRGTSHPPAHPLAIEITSITAHTALQSKETFDVFGTKGSFFWGVHPGDPHTLVERTVFEPMGHDKANPVAVSKLQTPALPLDLPTPLQTLAGSTVPRRMVHEFVSSCQENRPSILDVEEAVAITKPGIEAHAAAMSRISTPTR